ncbi:MAG: hypothetical protein R6V52_04355 [Bacteroidales bacterium]
MKTFLLPMLLLLLLSTSCKVMYKPSMQNVPLLQNKGDVTSTVSYNNYQVAYGLTDNLGVMLNGHYNKNQWASTSAHEIRKEYITSRYSLEGGLGYYSNFDENSVFEIYGGGGYGAYDYNFDKFENDNYLSTYEYAAASWRAFVQPSVGYSTDNFQIAFSTRFMGVGFFDIAYKNYTESELSAEDINDLDGNIYPFLEPALTIRAGSEVLKFHIQLIYSRKLTNQSLSYMPLNLNFGVNLSFSNLYRD